jgi:hypothetical protein
MVTTRMATPPFNGESPLLMWPICAGGAMRNVTDVEIVRISHGGMNATMALASFQMDDATV